MHKLSENPIQVLIVAQGAAQLRRQVEMAETLTKLSSQMFAFSLPASAPMQVPPIDIQPHRVPATLTGKPATSPGIPTPTGQTGIDRVRKSATGRPLNGEEAMPEHLDGDIDRDSDVGAGEMSSPLLPEASPKSADDTDFMLLNLYDHNPTLYAVTKYLEIAAHQLIVGAFICACAMLNKDKDGYGENGTWCCTGIYIIVACAASLLTVVFAFLPLRLASPCSSCS